MPLSGYTVFVDICLGSHKLPEELKSLGVRIERHVDHFARDCEDGKWLEVVGQRGWIILTKDEKILRRPAERAALEHAGAHAMFFGRQDATGDELIEAFKVALPKLDRLFATVLKPTFVAISKSGKVRVIN